MKILCPTDFSDHSNVALKEAIFIANKTQSKIILLSAYIVPSTSANLIRLNDVIQKNTEEELSKIKGRIQNQSDEGVEIETVALEGVASIIICDYAMNHDIDLIVMGTQGSTNMQNILLGSVTKSIFNKSQVPVLAIPSEVLQGGIGQRFLLTLDNQPIDTKKTVIIIPELLKVYNGRLNVFHVSQQQDLIPIDPFIEEYLPELIENFIVESGKNVVNVIKQYVVDNNVNLLIMIRRKKSKLQKLLLKGHTEEELFRTKIPMLMLPDVT